MSHRTLVIDMPSGIAGDMLLAALIGCGADVDAVARALDGLGLGPFGIQAEACEVGHLCATRVRVQVPQEAQWNPLAPPSASEHVHRPYRDIRALISSATLDARVRQRALAVFAALAQAEATVHGVAADEVEFHEVGSRDAIADVVGVCVALELLHIDALCAGTVNPGRGTVRCAHGLMPVPVPAVADMLRTSAWPTRIPGSDTGELTTPTGMALLIGLGQPNATPPSGVIIASGFGAGRKIIPGFVNACRCVILESSPYATAHPRPWRDERVVQIEAHCDDATGEDLAAISDRLIEQGARDAFVTAIQMKKSRCGQLITVLCDEAHRDRLIAWLFQHTPTIGVRHALVERAVLPRRMVTVQVEGHDIALKVVTLPDGTQRAKAERDHVTRAALALGLHPAHVARRAETQWLGCNQESAHVNP